MEIIRYVTEDGSDLFQEWIDSLRDARAVAAVLRRVDRAAGGNFGDHRFCRDGVFELRIDQGPGYRVYYFQYGQMFVVLLCGGDKRVQDDDIDRAVACRADFLCRIKEKDR
ncbi:MAG: type II toxin-antitoxin system RelE/ParE family toxin [Synergistaceae bacterium]|nr:type II toxin-antitoxin system RelE/ParE family toxin [Synergistaceae bacterium]